MYLKVPEKEKLTHSKVTRHSPTMNDQPTLIKNHEVMPNLALNPFNAKIAYNTFPKQLSH